MVMRKGINKAVAAAVEAIKGNSQMVSGSADIARVGTVSSGDEAVGALIAEAMEKVTVQWRHHHRRVARPLRLSLEVVEGMEFDRGYHVPLHGHRYRQDGGCHGRRATS